MSGENWSVRKALLILVGLALVAWAGVIGFFNGLNVISVWLTGQWS